MNTKTNPLDAPTLTTSQLQDALDDAASEIREYGEVSVDELLDYLGDYYRAFSFDRAAAKKLASKMCK